MYSCHYPVVRRIKSSLADQMPVGMGVGKRGETAPQATADQPARGEGRLGGGGTAPKPAFGNGPGAAPRLWSGTPSPGLREQRRSITQGEANFEWGRPNRLPNRQIAGQLPPNLQADRLQNCILITNFKDRRKSYKVSLFKCLIYKLDCYTINQKVN